MQGTMDVLWTDLLNGTPLLGRERTIGQLQPGYAGVIAVPGESAHTVSMRKPSGLSSGTAPW